MKIVRVVVLISVLLISCTEERRFIKISDDPYIEYLKIGSNVSVYTSDFKLGEGDDLNSQGMEFAFKKNYDEARQKFIQALLLEPNDPIILNNLGNVERHNYEFEKAIEYFEKSLIASDSLYISAGINLGKTYSLIGEKERSDLLLNEILKKTDIEFFKGLCYLQLTRGHLEYREIEKAKLSFSKASLIFRYYDDFKDDLNELDSKIKAFYD